MEADTLTELGKIHESSKGKLIVLDSVNLQENTEEKMEEDKEITEQLVSYRRLNFTIYLVKLYMTCTCRNVFIFISVKREHKYSKIKKEKGKENYNSSNQKKES